MPGTVVVNQPGVIPVDSEGELLTDGWVFFEFLKTITAAGPSYFIAVDLSNSSGDFPHTETGGITLARASGFLDKDTANASWEADVGIILAIDGTNATLLFLAALSNNTDKTNSFLATQTFASYPIALPFKVVGGELPKFISNNVVVTTDINTGSSLEDTGGNSIAPAVGDLIIKVERTTGSGEAIYGLSGSYLTVA